MTRNQNDVSETFVFLSCLEKIQNENPDLSIDLIKDILMSKEEIVSAKLSEYLFD